MILCSGPSTPANPAGAEHLPAQSIMPPLRGPVDSPATLRGFGSYRLRHPSAAPRWPGRNDGHHAQSPGADSSPAHRAMRDLRAARDLAITTREAVPLDLRRRVDRGAPPGRRARAPGGITSAVSQRTRSPGHYRAINVPLAGGTQGQQRATPTLRTARSEAVTAIRYTFQAGHAGSIPVARSTAPAQVRDMII